MSEYMEKYSVSRLIGSAPGYIGYEKGGQLTEKVRQNPYSIVLFDEIDKANVDVLNLLLQIMDNGTLTDARGRQINFRNTIIIMTSNLGSDMSSGSKDYNELKNMLLKHLRPEFINRIDEVVKFNSLDEKTIKDIVELELNKLKNRLMKNSNVKMTYDKEVVEYIAKNSYDPAFGARPIRRYIQKNLEGTLALNLIDGKIKEGDNVPIVIDKDKIVVVTSKKDELN